MEDVQNYPDERRIPIDEVGVSDLRYPIVVLDREQQTQQTVACITMSVSLPHHFKGTHMSRFIEVLNRHRGEVTMRTLPTMLTELRDRLEAERARIELRFPYFLERTAPISRARSLMEYECSFLAELNAHEKFVLGVNVPLTSLCPCSKTISDYGAHNQRGFLRIEVQALPSLDGESGFLWIEELIDLAEQCGSSPIYPLLKRQDERHVTMQAYDNPVFVEDMVRNVAVRLQTDPRVGWFRAQAVNQESIHNHNAFATVQWHRNRVSDQ